MTKITRDVFVGKEHLVHLHIKKTLSFRRLFKNVTLK